MRYLVLVALLATTGFSQIGFKNKEISKQGTSTFDIYGRIQPRTDYNLSTKEGEDAALNHSLKRVIFGFKAGYGEHLKLKLQVNLAELHKKDGSSQKTPLEDIELHYLPTKSLSFTFGNFKRQWTRGYLRSSSKLLFTSRSLLITGKDSLNVRKMYGGRSAGLMLTYDLSKTSGLPLKLMASSTNYESAGKDNADKGMMVNLRSLYSVNKQLNIGASFASKNPTTQTSSDSKSAFGVDATFDNKQFLVETEYLTGDNTKISDKTFSAFSVAALYNLKIAGDGQLKAIRPGVEYTSVKANTDADLVVNQLKVGAAFFFHKNAWFQLDYISNSTNADGSESANALVGMWTFKF